jgi:hypothetical protein
VLRCLEKQRDRRFSSVAALAEDLSPFASALGRSVASRLRAREPRAEDEAPAKAASSEAETLAAGTIDVADARPPKRSAELRWPRRGRRVLAIAGALTALAAAPVAVLTLARPAAPPPVTPSAAAATTPAVEPVASQALREASLASATSAPEPRTVASVLAAPPPAPSSTQVPRVAAAVQRVARPSVAAPAVSPAPAKRFGGSALDDHR